MPSLGRASFIERESFAVGELFPNLSVTLNIWQFTSEGSLSYGTDGSVLCRPLVWYSRLQPCFLYSVVHSPAGRSHHLLASDEDSFIGPGISPGHLARALGVCLLNA
jgi:hypothetical protein